jgi:hypothetical protein
VGNRWRIGREGDFDSAEFFLDLAECIEARDGFLAEVTAFFEGDRTGVDIEFLGKVLLVEIGTEPRPEMEDTLVFPAES